MSEYEGKVPYRKLNTLTLTELLYYEATGEIMPYKEDQKENMSNASTHRQSVSKK